MQIEARVPRGPLSSKWNLRRDELPSLGAADRKLFTVLVIGNGIAGLNAAAALAELGYHVECFFRHDSPRRAASVIVREGINACKNYLNDGDSVERFYRDTLAYGGGHSRPADVYRMAELSCSVLDQLTAQAVPFDRTPGGTLLCRSHAHSGTARCFTAGDYTGQQILLAAYGAVLRLWKRGFIKLHAQSEVLDLVVVDGCARGVVVLDLASGEVRSHAGHAVVLATGGYSGVFSFSTGGDDCGCSAFVSAFRQGAVAADPSFVEFHPWCAWLPDDSGSKRISLFEELQSGLQVRMLLETADEKEPQPSGLDGPSSSSGGVCPPLSGLPHDEVSRRMLQISRENGDSGPFCIELSGADAALKRAMLPAVQRYFRITGNNALKQGLLVRPAPHCSIGGLWVDYDLMTSLPGLFAVGEANFAVHGARRLAGNGLLKSVVEGGFVLPLTIGEYLSGLNSGAVEASGEAFGQAQKALEMRISSLLDLQGQRLPGSVRRELGEIVWQGSGPLRSEAGLQDALKRLEELRGSYRQEITVGYKGRGFNHFLVEGLLLEDCFILAELMCRDALARRESCGVHYREDAEEGSGKDGVEKAVAQAVYLWQRPVGQEEFLLFRRDVAAEKTESSKEGCMQ